MHKQTAKFVGVIAQNLPDMSDDLMQGWIENPKSLQKVLKNVLCPPEAVPNFEVWKTIKLGMNGLKTAEDFRKDIKDCGMKISGWAKDILGKSEFTAVTEETAVDLVKVTVAELGFKNGACRDRIYDRAKELGLELCPVEVGPQLRLQYKDQPNGERIRVGMEPIRGSDNDLKVFCVERLDSGFWLNGGYGVPDSFWGAGSQWVFVRPRKYQK